MPTCSKCRQEKEAGQFWEKQRYCRSCATQYQRNHYAKQGTIFSRLSVQDKEKMLDLYLNQGKSVRCIAMEYGIPYTTMSRWIKALREREQPIMPVIPEAQPIESH